MQFPKCALPIAIYSGVLCLLLAGVSLISSTPASAQSAASQKYVFTSQPLGDAPIGRWNRITITSPDMKTGVLDLDPNRIIWDGVGSTWVSTRMATVQIPIRFIESKNPPARPEGKMRVFDLEAMGSQSPTKEFPLLPVKGRLVVSSDPAGPVRLLVFGEKDRIERVLPMERPVMTTSPRKVGDVFALQTVFLGESPVRQMGRQVHIMGSLNTGEATLDIDPNAKTLNNYGDTVASTMMATMPQKVTLKEVTDKPGIPTGQKLYDLEGAQTKMQLLLSQSPLGPNRLILLNEEGKPTRTLPLEHYVMLPGDLRNVNWQLQKIAYNDDTTHIPPSNYPYTISLQPDGRFVGRAGVNRLMGTFTVAGNAIAFSPLAMTRAASVNDSIDSQFFKALGQVSSYKVNGNELWLMLKMDSGTMIFKKAAPEKR